MTTETVQTRLAGLPTQPGVYIMRDARNRVIYVGKAINLRNRVRSYFQEQRPPGPQNTQPGAAQCRTSNGSWWALSWKR